MHHVHGPLAWLEAEARLRAWKAELRARGIDPPPPLEGNWSATSGGTSTVPGSLVAWVMPDIGKPW